MIVSIWVFVTARLQFRTSHQIISPERCIVTLFYCFIVYLMVRILDSKPFKDNLWADAISLKIFWHVKVTQPFLSFRVHLVYMFLSQRNIFCHFTSLNFHIIAVGFLYLHDGFPYLPGGNLTPRSHPGKSSTLTFSPLSQAVPNGAQRQGVINSFGNLPQKWFS